MTAKLITTEYTRPKECYYCSLSHCWGELMIFKLLKDNRDDMHENIPLEDLPKTFLDAFHVALALGIDYIWIDSLCIIQDDEGDWRREAAAMSQIYQNAFVNIAATKSVNGSQGLFHDRSFLSLRTKIELDHGPAKGTFQLLDRDYWEDKINQAPLNTRAWVVQERHLSPRILHFTAGQIVWDCGEMAHAESLLSPYGEIWSGRNITNQGSKSMLRLETDQEASDLANATDRWVTVVHSYSSSQLTYRKDKLVAIAGLVKHTEHITHDEYCAGLWRHNIEFQLAWYTSQTETLAPPYTGDTQRAPSWSWLSFDGPVTCPLQRNYEGYEIVTMAYVSKVDIQQVQSSDGDCFSGHLEVYTAITTLEVSNNDTPAPTFHVPDAISWPFQSDHTRLICNFDYTIRQAELTTAQYCFLPLFGVFYGRTLESTFSDAAEIHGLIVRLVAADPPTYIRCGHSVLFTRLDAAVDSPSTYFEAIEAARDLRNKWAGPIDQKFGGLVRLV